jgi:hypothetical protein
MNNSAGPAKGSWSDQEVEKLRVLVEKADEDPTQAKISKRISGTTEMQKQGMYFTWLISQEAASLQDQREHSGG